MQRDSQIGLRPDIVLTPGQALEMTDIKLKISVVETTVVALTVEQLATQQVKAEEKQRVLGIIPNFFVVYDKDAVPLTKKLKYELAFRAATDVVSIAGDVFLAGVNQAADTPNYQLGAEGFGQRFGAAYADSFSNVMIGGAVLPSLLHQDPRYFYQGTGSRKSRAIHAMSYAIICKGDNGRSQFNYSGIGGNLIAAPLQTYTIRRAIAGQDWFSPVRSSTPGADLPMPWCRSLSSISIRPMRTSKVRARESKALSQVSYELHLRGQWFWTGAVPLTRQSLLLLQISFSQLH